MADAMRTAEYSKEDGPYVLPVGFQQGTTTELTALTTARKLNIGSLYYDTTLAQFKIALRKDFLSSNLLYVGYGSDTTISNLICNGRADTTGTPGNATINSNIGRAAFAAAGTSVIVTKSKVTATSEIFLQLRGARDTTLTEARISAQGAGTFTVTGNAAATAAVQFSFWVVN